MIPSDNHPSKNSSFCKKQSQTLSARQMVLNFVRTCKRSQSSWNFGMKSGPTYFEWKDEGSKWSDALEATERVASLKQKRYMFAKVWILLKAIHLLSFFWILSIVFLDDLYYHCLFLFQTEYFLVKWQSKKATQHVLFRTYPAYSGMYVFR